MRKLEEINMKDIKRIGLLGGICMLFLAGCSNHQIAKVETEQNVSTTDIKVTASVSPTRELATEPANTPELPSESMTEPTAESTKKPIQKPTKEPIKETDKPIEQTNTIVIDAGHQSKGNPEKEPIGPGASITKAKVLSGTSGVSTGVPEYKVTLQVAKKLQKVLEKRGYQVIMVRMGNDVNISNTERAEIANQNHADAFIRIHCNGSENSSATGALTMCQTKDNPYCGKFYKQSRALSESVIKELCSATGARNAGIIETDTMSGINWCQVPVTIVEMGFMTNPKEDRKLNDESYQNKLARGIADGVERFLQKLNKK